MFESLATLEMRDAGDTAVSSASGDRRWLEGLDLVWLILATRSMAEVRIKGG
ncbi:hypothetical protein J2Z50_006540 [Ensifer mexicanus]|nr:hypothetical protein [Sinorhizobium mexicanum]